MVLWRISRHHDLSGMGGLKAAARWHYAGHPIIYLTETPAAALLEICVHTSAGDIPPAFTMLRIHGPALDPTCVNEDDLPEDWRARLEVTRDLGTAWLKKNESVLLRVPSAIAPRTMNVLYNPAHVQAKEFRITAAISYPFDRRLKG